MTFSDIISSMYHFKRFEQLLDIYLNCNKSWKWDDKSRTENQERAYSDKHPPPRSLLDWWPGVLFPVTHSWLASMFSGHLASEYKTIIWNPLLIWGEEWPRDSEPINIYLQAGPFNQIFFIQLSKTNQKANQFCNLESWWHSNFAFCAFKSALFSFLCRSADSKNHGTTAASRRHLHWAELTGEIRETILSRAQRWNASRMLNKNFFEMTTKTQCAEWHRSVWRFQWVMSPQAQFEHVVPKLLMLCGEAVEPLGSGVLLEQVSLALRCMVLTHFLLFYCSL